ncbi:MAG: ABC transporter substrate-binding protein [Kofleriaceae bacterium]
MNLRGWGRRAGLVGLLAVALGATACKGMSGEKEGAAGSGGAAPSTGPIKVGHYASLTGNEATFGVSTDNGIRLAVEERNAAGGVKGRKIELKTLDTASQAAQGGTVVTRLISQDKVVAVLGEVASSISLAGGQVAQQLGVPMISPSSTNLKVTAIGDKIFRVCFTDDFQAYVIAKFLRDDLKLDRVAILHDQQQAYSKGLADDFRKIFVELGGTIAGDQTYTGGNPDVSAQLQTIKSAGAQAVFLPGYYTDAGNYMQQAKKMGLTVPFLGGDGWDSAELIKIAGDAIEGSYYSNHYSHQDERPEVQKFVATYKAKFGAVPDGLAALGYDAARVLFDAMERAPSLGGADLAAAIAATKDFPGVTGAITIDGNRNAQKKAVILQVKDGVPTYVTSIWPKGMAPADDAAAGSGDGSAAAAGSADGSAAAAPADGSAAPLGLQGGLGGGGDGTGAGDGEGGGMGRGKGTGMGKADRKAEPLPTKMDPDDGGE